MITIKQTKEIREKLGLNGIVIFGYDENLNQHVASHGKSGLDARQTAKFGNDLKKHLGWPKELCNTKPLERICQNCSFFQRGYHSPGDVIQSNMHGKCMFNPEPIKRHEQDRACAHLEPNS